MVASSKAAFETFLYDSPIGVLELEASASALSAIRFSKHAAMRGKTDHPVLKKTIAQLDEYFTGKRTSFDIPLTYKGSTFQEKSRKNMSAIPYGKTLTYGELAKKSGYPKAARAIGTVCSGNPHPIIVPCHRVLGSTKKYTYAGGSTAKRWLLAHEGVKLAD